MGHSADAKRKVKLSCTERGPGPARYILPGTCGQANHDPTKHANPAFSFGIRHKNSSTVSPTKNSPGPVYFVNPRVTKHGPDGTPAFSIQGRPQNKTNSKAVTPGPDAYSTEHIQPMKTARPPSYSFGRRTTMVSKYNTTPAPNVYTLPDTCGSNCPSKSSSASYSITGRSKVGSFHEDLSNTPGPGTYKITSSSVVKSKPPTYSMIGRNYPPSSASSNPGPGMYSPEKVYINKKTLPSFSFGIRHSDYVAPVVESHRFC